MKFPDLIAPISTLNDTEAMQAGPSPLSDDKVRMPVGSDCDITHLSLRASASSDYIHAITDRPSMSPWLNAA